MNLIQNFIFTEKSTRLDKFLAQQFPDWPRRFFQLEIKQGNILVNDKKTNPDYKLKPNDRIQIAVELPKIDAPIQPQQDIPFDIIFQHSDFLIIDKPAGLSVHPSASEKSGTVANGLAFRFPDIINVGEDPQRPGIVHRLDKDTSGLMIVALTQNSFFYFKEQFQQHKIEKQYLAWVWGQLSTPKGIIKSYIGRSKSNPLKQASSVDPDKVTNAKEAITEYEVLQTKSDRSLIIAKPKTGRRHQIRIHFQGLGHPLVGDKKYQTKPLREKNQPFNRHLLHATALKFTYSDGQKYHFESPIPPDLI